MRITNTYKVIVHDLLMTILAWQLAWLARFNFSFVALAAWDAQYTILPLVVACQSILGWYLGLYRGIWRFASLHDLWNIIRAAVIGALTLTLLLFVINRLAGIPRSVLVFYPVLLIFGFGGPRLAYRLWKDRSLNIRRSTAGTRVLIVGAGRGGDMVLREMLRDVKYQPVGLIDDQAQLARRRIHGVPVLGPVASIPAFVEEQEVDMIFIAIPSASKQAMRTIVGYCEQAGKPFRTLPRFQDLGTDSTLLSKLREVSIDDLLGRDKVELDWASIQRGLSGKCVMVTGGGGSIGSEICNQLAQLGVAGLVVFDQSEFNLYAVEMSLRSRHPRLMLNMVLGDVCDRVAVEAALRRYRPDWIFHAAAYKHVPILECQPREAVRNNVLGTHVVAEAAIAHRCRKFVLISTDKAVNPASMLGGSKRVAELICTSLQEMSDTAFITVRFGNVLDSAGSVVPLFREQIQRGGPVTVTHPEVSRYFMTIPEASQLILQAANMGRGGEVFVLDMGEPIKIAYLAEQMIRLSGKKPHRDVKIEYVGLRPGEKLTEELFHSDENLAVTQHQKILLAPQRAGAKLRIADCLRELRDACEHHDETEVRARLHRILAEAVARSQSSAKVVPLR
jgi:FlaA1/EpsC-like NDP-sugar epimerase